MLGAALVAMLVIWLVGQALLRPDLPLIVDAGFSLPKITPNADGSDDVALFSYTLSRDAQVSLDLANEDGQTFTFRNHELRAPDDYQVEFSGVVDGFEQPGEDIAGEVLRRLIPNGVYTWTLTAEATESDETQAVSGQLEVADADLPLPEITSFSVWPDVFTPNQDGIRITRRLTSTWKNPPICRSIC